MFIYFIQKKGFLIMILTTRNAWSGALQQWQRSIPQFLSFLSTKLFHEGLAKEKKDRSSEFRELLGVLSSMVVCLMHDLDIKKSILRMMHRETVCFL